MQNRNNKVLDWCGDVVLEQVGSVRAVVNDGGISLETDDYYPLGGPLPTGTSTSLQPEKFQGKEWNPTASFNVYDFGARLYDPALGRWLSQDPLAEKYFAHSPYLFCAGNPMKFVDPTGSRIWLLFYTEGNKRGDEMFKAAAETRRNDIESSADFDSTKDIVIVQALHDISRINTLSQEIINEYSGAYGKTSELRVWSHGGFDGPVGSIPSSEYALDTGQMTLEGWGQTDYNWSNNANVNFFGCNTGKSSNKGMAFSTAISALDNFENVSIHGQSSSAYPSLYTNYRSNTKAMIQSMFSYPTYMVGGGRSGIKGHFSPISAKAHPMTTSYNGVLTNSNHFQEGKRR